MPELLWLYLTATLYYRTIASGVALSEALKAERGWLTGGLKVLVVREGAKDLCHQPPDAVRGRSPAAVSRSRPDRSGDQSGQGPTQPDGLSSALRAGPAPSYQLLPGGLLYARAGTA